MGLSGDRRSFSSSAVDPAVFFHRGEIRQHDGKGLVRPMFPPPKSLHRREVPRIAGQQKPAQALDGQDLSFFQETDGGGDRVRRGNRFPLWVDELKFGAAHRAGIGLGMEPAVCRVLVFPPAVRTHAESGHGGLGPVVGDVFDDGEAGTAVRAVGERIAVAAVRGSKISSRQAAQVAMSGEIS